MHQYLEHWPFSGVLGRRKGQWVPETLKWDISSRHTLATASFLHNLNLISSVFTQRAIVKKKSTPTSKKSLIFYKEQHTETAHSPTTRGRGLCGLQWFPLCGGGATCCFCCCCCCCSETPAPGCRLPRARRREACEVDCRRRLTQDWHQLVLPAPVTAL